MIKCVVKSIACTTEGLFPHVYMQAIRSYDSGKKCTINFVCIIILVTLQKIIIVSNIFNMLNQLNLQLPETRLEQPHKYVFDLTTFLMFIFDNWLYKNYPLKYWFLMILKSLFAIKVKMKVLTYIYTGKRTCSYIILR